MVVHRTPLYSGFNKVLLTAQQHLILAHHLSYNYARNQNIFFDDSCEEALFIDIYTYTVQLDILVRCVWVIFLPLHS